MCRQRRHLDTELVFLQTQRVHRVRVAHSPALLAAAGVSYPQCFAAGLLVLYAHSPGCRLSHRRPSDCHPDRIPRAVQGMITERSARRRSGDVTLTMLLSLSVTADVSAAHVLTVPRLHVRPAVDHLLRAGRGRLLQSEPERVLLGRHPHGPGVLEPRHSQHPPAHGPQQSGEPDTSLSVHYFTAYIDWLTENATYEWAEIIKLYQFELIVKFVHSGSSCFRW